MRLPPLKKNRFQINVTSRELQSVLNRPCDESEFILLTTGYFETLYHRSDGLRHQLQEAENELEKIRHHYLKTNYKDAIDLIKIWVKKISTSIVENNDRNLYQLILKKSNTLNKVETKKNNPRRLLENRLAQLYEGDEKINLTFESVNRVLANYINKPIQSVDDLFSAMVNLHKIYANCSFKQTDKEPDVNTIKDLPANVDCGFILVDKDFYVLDRINKTVRCVATQLTQEKIEQIQNIFKTEIMPHDDIRARLSVILTPPKQPVHHFFARSEAYDVKQLLFEVEREPEPYVSALKHKLKEKTSFINKDRRYKQGIQGKDNANQSDAHILSSNLGVMSSLSRNYRDEIDSQTQVNRNVDRGIISGSNQGFSYTHPNIPLVGSISGHACETAAVLANYGKNHAADQKQEKKEETVKSILETDINLTLQAFIMTFISYGFHSYGEVEKIFEEPLVKNLFSRYNVTIHDVPDYLLKMAFQDAQDYAKITALQDAAIYEQFVNHIKAKNWEKCCTLLSTFTHAKMDHFLKEADLQENDIRSFLNYAYNHQHEDIFDHLLVMAPQCVDKEKYQCHFPLKMSILMKELFEKDLYQNDYLRKLIKKDPRNQFLIQKISELRDLNFPNEDLQKGILACKDSFEAEKLLEKITDFHAADRNYSINLLDDNRLRKAIQENNKLELERYFQVLTMKFINVHVKDDILQLLMTSQHPENLGLGIRILQKQNLLSPANFDLIKSNPEEANYLSQAIVSISTLDDKEIQKKLYSVIEKNPWYPRINEQYFKKDKINEEDLDLLCNDRVVQACKKYNNQTPYENLRDIKRRCLNLYDEYEDRIYQGKLDDESLASQLSRLNIVHERGEKKLPNISQCVEYVIKHPEMHFGDFLFDSIDFSDSDNEYQERVKNLILNDPEKYRGFMFISLAADYRIEREEVLSFITSKPSDYDDSYAKTWNIFQAATSKDLRDFMLENIDYAGQILVAMRSVGDSFNESQQKLVALMVLNNPAHSAAIVQAAKNINYALGKQKSDQFESYFLSSCQEPCVANVRGKLNENLIRANEINLPSFDDVALAKKFNELIQTLGEECLDINEWLKAFNQHELLDSAGIDAIIAYVSQSVYKYQYDQEDLDHLLISLKTAREIDAKKQPVNDSSEIISSGVKTLFSFPTASRIAPISNNQDEKEHLNRNTRH